jgi:hypothetical protein
MRLPHVEGGYDMELVRVGSSGKIVRQLPKLQAGLPVRRGRWRFRSGDTSCLTHFRRARDCRPMVPPAHVQA